jgi:MFS family permease
VRAAAGDPAPRAHWRAAFAHRDYRFFLSGRLVSMLGMQMQSVTVGWQIYAITGRAIDLAWVGLAQFLPAAGLSLVTGHVADRLDRRRILLACNAATATLYLALYALARSGVAQVAPIYAVLIGLGVARAFVGPANQALMPSLVSASAFGNAVAWSSSLMQGGMVAGPMVGGTLYAALGGAAPVYLVSCATSLTALTLVASIRPRQAPAAAAAPARPAATRESVLAGVRYVRNNPIVLGAISLDLFAVLLGGATALLPIYARDVLHLGPWALGALRSAPAVGAATTGAALAVWPIQRRAGARMLWCVALYGVATIVFGLSRTFALSVAALVVAGAADMVSVFVRLALLQLATPDAMRGRVSAVNMVFIGASNELGEFESGLVAQWLGAVRSVVVGGIGTLVVVALWAWRFPDLRRVDRLEDVAPKT